MLYDVKNSPSQIVKKLCYFFIHVLFMYWLSMYGTGFDQFLFPFEVYSSLMSYHILYIYRNLVQSIKHVKCIYNKCWLDKVSFKNFSVCNWLYFKMFNWYLKLFILDLFINIRFASNYIADFQTYFDLNLRIA